jgi:hypothetical protein
MPDLLTRPVAVGDQFIETTPSGRRHIYTVTELDAVTPQGYRLPRATSPRCHGVFITDELLDQEWWQPDDGDQSSERPADTPARDADSAESHGRAGSS